MVAFGNPCAPNVQLTDLDAQVPFARPGGSAPPVPPPNQDRPGVIGFIGSLLGKNKINIAAMQVGRKARGGEAVTVVNVDSPVPENVLRKIRAFKGISRAKSVHL